jgi:hypothetical protein
VGNTGCFGVIQAGVDGSCIPRPGIPENMNGLYARLVSVISLICFMNLAVARRPLWVQRKKYE